MPDVVMDYTTMSDYLKCPRRGYYRHDCNIVPQTPATPLIFGGAIHEGLASWYQHGDEERALESFCSYWDREAQLPKEDEETEDLSDFQISLAPSRPGDEKRNRDSGLNLLRRYFSHYKTENFKILSNEFPFNLPLGTSEGITYRLTGKIDLFVQWGDQTYVMDHKTTSMLGPKYFDQFKLSMQLRGYAWAARELFKECDGAMVNAIFVGKTFKFARDIFAYTSEDFSLYVENTMAIMHDIHKARKLQRFPMNTDACMLYGSCPYREICEARGDERVIRNRYTTREWNPFFA